MNITKLAQHLDLSIGTVSRALNGKPDVSAKTRERVLDAAIKYGYSANASGRSLRRGTTQTVAFVLETGRSNSRPGDNFFMRVIDAMQTELQEADYDLIILPCQSASDPVGFLKRAIARGAADAMVVTATQRNDARVKLLMKSRMPFVTLGRTGLEPDHAWIDLDFEGYVIDIVKQLYQRGHRRIAIAVPPGSSNIAHLMREAYYQVHETLGLKPDPSLIFAPDVSEYGGSLIVQELLRRPDRATALLLNYELMALGVYNELRTAGLYPGKDLSVVTMRNSRQIRFLEPPLAAYDIDLETLGRELARASLDMITGNRPPAKMIWPGRFVETASIAGASGSATR